MSPAVVPAATSSSRGDVVALLAEPRLIALLVWSQVFNSSGKIEGTPFDVDELFYCARAEDGDGERYGGVKANVIVQRERELLSVCRGCPGLLGGVSTCPVVVHYSRMPHVELHLTGLFGHVGHSPSVERPSGGALKAVEHAPQE